MIKTLVSIEVDLPSSLAMRFACQLGSLMEMEIHPVYVKDAPPHDSSMGAGWASRTWEKELIRRGKAEISELIRPEMDFCHVIREPRVIYGDREWELLRITQQEEFTFFVEGVHFPWASQFLVKHLHTNLHQKLSVPQVLVRSPRKLNRVLLLCPDASGTRAVTALFQTVWGDCPVPLVLAYPGQDGRGVGDNALREAVLLGEQRLKEAGCNVDVEPSLPRESGADATKLVKDFGLVALASERHIHKESEPLQWLSQVESSALLAFH